MRSDDFHDTNLHTDGTALSGVYTFLHLPYYSTVNYQQSDFIHC